MPQESHGAPDARARAHLYAPRCMHGRICMQRVCMQRACYSL